MFTFQIEAEGKPITNQKSSGRCWLFAALNVIRLPVIKHLNVEDLELSQSYLFFWDRIERCNFVLHNIVQTAKRNEPVDGRLVSFILHVSRLNFCYLFEKDFHLFASILVNVAPKIIYFKYSVYLLNL